MHSLKFATYRKDLLMNEGKDTTSSDGAGMIQMRHVGKWYGEFQVLSNCTTSVDKGEVVVVARNERLSHFRR